MVLQQLLITPNDKLGLPAESHAGPLREQFACKGLGSAVAAYRLNSGTSASHLKEHFFLPELIADLFDQVFKLTCASMDNQLQPSDCCHDTFLRSLLVLPDASHRALNRQPPKD